MPSSTTSAGDDSQERKHMSVHYGLYLRFDSSNSVEERTVLPLTVDIRGYCKRPFVSSRLLSTAGEEHRRSHLNVLFTSWDKDIGAGPLLEMFKGFPLLLVHDASLIMACRDDNPSYTANKKSSDQDMSVYPPKALSTTWGLQVSIDENTIVRPPTQRNVKHPKHHSFCNHDLQACASRADPAVHRFTDLVLLVEEAKKYE